MTTSPRRVAVLAEDGYQELEVWYPTMRFREEGAEVTVAAPDAERAYESQLGYPLLAQTAIAGLPVTQLDVVVVPGADAGTRLAAHQPAVDLLRDAHTAGALVAAIGTGRKALRAAGLEASASERVVEVSDADELPVLVRSLCRAPGHVG